MVEDSGTNVYQLAKNAELDRTTIQRSLLGERLPSFAFVEKLCDYLRVSPTKRKELMELYSISKIGEKTHAGRKYIKELLEQVATLHINGKGNSNSSFQKSMHVSGDTYREDFQRCISQTTPFVQHLNGCGDMITAYFEAFQNSGQITHVMEPQPCFSKYYTHELINKHLRPDIPQRDEIKQRLFDYYDSSVSPLQSFFSIEGLKHMVDTGAMADLPARFAIPFTVAERKALILSLQNDIKNNTYIARAADSSKIRISSFASVQYYKNKGLMFIAANDNGIVSCTITEKSICDSFHDFFESLLKSDLIYSAEETIKVLDGFLTQLETM